jgi:HK97 gp10 family phage protein
MAKVTVHLEGEEELKAKLEALGRLARGRALEDAAMAGAEVIRADAEHRAPGPHIEAVVTQAADLAVEVGIGPDKAHWYYCYFESGASRHGIRPKNRKALALGGPEGPEVRFEVDHPGMVAEPFLRPAMDAKGDEATRATGEELRRGIERVAAA